MTDDRKSGIALLAGSVGGMLTMALHPTGAGSLTRDQVAHLALVSGVVHSLAMISVLLLFLGCCGLTRRIAAADRIAFTAIVIFGFACIALFIAAAVSGFIVPNIMRHMVRDIPVTAQQWNNIIYGIFQINQAFASIYAVASSIAILLWSASALRNGGVKRGICIFGCIVAPLIVLGVAMGHLRLDVHGMAAIVLSHSIWFIAVGAQLCSRPRNGLNVSLP